MEEGSRIRLAFDAEAIDYDQDFSSLPATQKVRAAIWAEVEERLGGPGGSVLDLGCGTGEDAAFLARTGYKVLATDISGRMLAQARKKLTGYAGVRFLQSGIEGLPSLLKPGIQFDAILSNFGALNCLQSLTELQTVSDRFLKPGGFLFLGLIGRFYLRELVRGEFRRLRPSGSPVQMKDGYTVRCFYHFSKNVAWSGYLVREVWGLGVFGHSDVWKFWPLNRLGDHCFLVAQKQDRAPTS